MKTFGAILLLGILVAGCAAYRLRRPYASFPGQTFVDVPYGTSTTGLAQLLARSGVVRSRWDFLLAGIFMHGRKLQAGEYAFDRPATPLDVYRRIAGGDVFYYELKVPEGKNMFEIADAIGKLGVFSAGDFLEAARDPGLIRDLDPKAPSLEGYLFPSVYHVGRHTTPQQLCKMMTDRFRAVWAKLHVNADVHRTVTLASLVEKEDKLDKERPLIAAVFDNRLRIGMKLDCDPTTIYAAELRHAYRGAIYQSDLARDDPYNTYRSPGLPPGPIANPGVPSIQAALNPADSQDLFFVLRPDGSGAHQFSTKLATHELAAARYRRGRKR